MAFKSEYDPPPEQETSEFLKMAREILRTGKKENDAWTVDREKNQVLFYRVGTKLTTTTMSSGAFSTGMIAMVSRQDRFASPASRMGLRNAVQ